MIWEMIAKKTTNRNASHNDPRYFATPDGLYILKAAPWIIEAVIKETKSLDCKRMTTHDNDGDGHLSTEEKTQHLRVLYPKGNHNSNPHNLVEVRARFCMDKRARDKISLINLNESRTIVATQGMILLSI